MASITSFGQTRSSMAGKVEQVFIIDGKKITDFTGKELIGKTVKEYSSKIETDKKSGKITFVNVINTTNKQSKISLGQTIFFVDDKRIDRKDVKAISPDSIQSIQVYKAGNKEAEELSGNNTTNVVKITLKNNK